MLTWQLCDLKGVVIGNFLDRQSGTINLGLNDQRSGSVKVSVEDEATALVKPFETVVKVSLRTTPILCGIVRRRAYADGYWTLELIDSSIRLQQGFTSYGEGGYVPYEFFAIDQSQIMAALMEAADASDARKAQGVPSHGIIRGSLPTSKTRDRMYPDGTNIWEAITNMAAVIDGPDFELQPLNRTDGIFCQLNTYWPKQGTDRTQAVVFEYGFGRENAADFQPDESGPPINAMVVAGKSRKGRRPDAWRSELLDSEKRFGVYAGFESDTDLKDIQTLHDHADGVVSTSAYPLAYFDVTAQPERPSTALPGAGDDEEFGSPPRFGPDGDYWLGDTIKVIAKKLPGLVGEYVGRITDVELTEAEDGSVSVKSSCVPQFSAQGMLGAQIALQTDSI